MTIIRPNKNKNYWPFAFCMIGASILVCIILTIFLYSVTVGFRYEVQRVETSIEDLRLSNAELRGELSRLTSFEHLQQIAEANGLIRDKNPQWVFAFQ